MSIAFTLTPEGQAWNDYEIAHQKPLTPEELEQIAFNAKMITISGWVMCILLLAFLVFMILRVRKQRLFNLNTKLKKIGFILLLTGYVSFSFGLIVAVASLKPLSKYPVLTDIISSLKYSIKFTNYSDANLFLGYGFYLLIFSIFLICLYDKTAGKIINWVNINNLKKNNE